MFKTEKKKKKHKAVEISINTLCVFIHVKNNIYSFYAMHPAKVLGKTISLNSQGKD